MQPIFNPINGVTSQNLNILEVLELYNPKYSLTESDINNYIEAYDKITNSLGCNKYKLTEGITNNRNKYNNILIDLYHQTIPSEIIDEYPIGIVFNIKQDKHYNILDLTKEDINRYKSSKQINMDFYGEITSDNYFYQDMQEYKTEYSNYAGNSYTYYVFKQITKLLLTEVYLYEYQGKILTYSELFSYYYKDILEHSDPSSIKSISEMIESKEITKVKYQCVKVSDPTDINFLTLEDLHIQLVNVNKLSSFEDAYSSLITKSFIDLINFEKSSDLKENLELNKKNLTTN